MRLIYDNYNTVKTKEFIVHLSVLMLSPALMKA